MNGFLIPANSKKSMLLFGLFETIDLIIFLSGVGATLILLLIMSADTIAKVIIVLVPVAVAAFLIMPVPNYHNMRVIIRELWVFYTTRQKFIWKGWCAKDGEDTKK
jgi:hypothetical protein